jgi:outer membrane protein TolC
MPGYKKDTRIFTGYKNDNALNFTLNESVYNGGADIATLAEARLGLKYQEQTLRARKLDVEFEAKRLFYGILLAYETRRIARDLVDQAQAHYEETAKMYKHGTASKFDVLQSKVNVSVVYPQLVNAENAIELIMAEFKKLLSLDMMRPIEIDGKLAYKLIEINTEEFLSEAYRRNPQMILKLLGIDINKWAIEYAKAGWYPDISANAAYAFNSNTMSSMLGSRHSNWSVGVKASIAIFDGFATKAKVDEAKARYNQSRLQKEDLAEQLAVDVVSACLDLEKAKAIIDAESDSISEAKESLRLANIRFENGVGINLDIIDAQVALAQVQQSLAQAIYDYIMAKAQLDRTMGHEFYKEEHYYANP